MPRTLGEWDDGHPIKVAIGRFGPYVQYGPKKYASLKKEDDPYTVTLERARQVIREKQEVEANRIIKEFPEAGIQVLNGRYGPYISDGKKNGKIPKDRDPKSLTIDECKALHRGGTGAHRGRWGRKTAAKTAAAKQRQRATSAKATKKSAKTAAGEWRESRERRDGARQRAQEEAAAKKKAPAKKKTASEEESCGTKKTESSPVP